MKYIKEFHKIDGTQNPSDYTIFKIRYYADGINVRKGKFDGDDKQHWERAKEYNSFFWKMVEKVTNQNFDYWCMEYFLSSNECAIEELFEKYGIYIPKSEEFYYWYIPNTLSDVIDWIKSECKLPFQIVQRAPYNQSLRTNKPTTWQRERAREFTKKNLSKHLPKK